MAITLSSKGLTEKQIAMAEPIKEKIAQYDRKIAHERTNVDILHEPYAKARGRRDRIAKLTEERSKETEKLNDILNKRSEYDRRLHDANVEVDALLKIKNTYGF